MGHRVRVHYRQREDEELARAHVYVGIVAFQFRDGEIRMRCSGCKADEWGHHDGNIEWVEMLAWDA
jgi:hypothetical protein